MTVELAVLQGELREVERIYYEAVKRKEAAAGNA
jgi:hypothetical protein